MGSKLTGRLLVLGLALLRQVMRQSFDPARNYRRILIAHHLLLGDTLLLTPMLAKLRARYPDSEIWMTVSPAFENLYDGKPYGVQVLPYHPREVGTLLPWLRLGEFDLALIPGDNRYSWLARALGARCIIALKSDVNDWKNWQVDQFVALPTIPRTLAEIFEDMVDGQKPPAFETGQWPTRQTHLNLPQEPYCILHVSARNPLRQWPIVNWQQIGLYLRGRGYCIVWSTAPGEDAVLNAIKPEISDISFPGTLNLKELRYLISKASLLITVETGIAHLCRITGTPSVVIYGQGNPALHGSEPFWNIASPMEALFKADVSCRNQSHLFKRQIPWVQRCDRGQEDCSLPICINAILPEHVLTSIDKLNKRMVNLHREPLDIHGNSCA